MWTIYCRPFTQAEQCLVSSLGSGLSPGSSPARGQPCACCQEPREGRARRARESLQTPPPLPRHPFLFSDSRGRLSGSTCKEPAPPFHSLCEAGKSGEAAKGSGSGLGSLPPFSPAPSCAFARSRQAAPGSRRSGRRRRRRFAAPGARSPASRPGRSGPRLLPLLGARRGMRSRRWARLPAVRGAGAAARARGRAGPGRGMPRPGQVRARRCGPGASRAAAGSVRPGKGSVLFSCERKPRAGVCRGPAGAWGGALEPQRLERHLSGEGRVTAPGGEGAFAPSQPNFLPEQHPAPLVSIGNCCCGRCEVVEPGLKSGGPPAGGLTWKSVL